MEQQREAAAAGSKPELPSTIINDSLRLTRQRDFHGNRWGARHVEAWERPQGVEAFLRASILGWAMIGEHYRLKYQSNMGQDGFLGPAWKDMGAGLRTLLNGDTGRFDCGTLDALICDVAAACGVEFD